MYILHLIVTNYVNSVKTYTTLSKLCLYVPVKNSRFLKEYVLLKNTNLIRKTQEFGTQNILYL